MSSVGSLTPVPIAERRPRTVDDGMRAVCFIALQTEGGWGVPVCGGYLFEDPLMTV